MGNYLKRIKTDIILNLKAIIIFETVYRVLSAILLWELFNRGISLALQLSGYSYLTVENLLSFICRPATVIIMLLLMAIIFLLQMLEISVLFTGFKASASNCKLRLSELVFLGFRNIKSVLKLRNSSAFIPVMIFGITVNSCFLWRLVVHVRPVDYCLQRIDDKTLLVFSGIVLLILFYVLLAVVIYQLMYLILERESMNTGRSLGLSFFKKKAFRTLVSVTAVNLSAGAVYYFLNKVFLNAFGALISLIASEKYHLALMLTASDYTDVIAAAISAVFSAVLISGICVSMFMAGKGDKLKWESTINLYWIPERFRKAVKISAICIALVMTGIYTYNAVYNGAIKPESSLFSIQITSHRGSSSQAPENTLPAIEKAIENMSDYIEIDVQMTKDGAVVLLHDQSLKRTAGVDRKLQDMTYEEVKKLDAGSWYGSEFEGTGIPDLEEVMQLVKGKASLNIEMKRNASGENLPEAVVALIEEYDMEKQCVITSTDHDYLLKVKELNPDLRTGYIVAAAYGNYFDDDSVDFFSVCSSYLSESVVKEAHAYGKEIHAWTVNSIKELNRMKRIQVDNVITDNPILARSVLYQ